MPWDRAAHPFDFICVKLHFTVFEACALVTRLVHVEPRGCSWRS